MIEVIFFSIAGSGHVQEIDDLLTRWADAPYVPKEYKLAIQHTLEIVEEGGHYPALTYYGTFFTDTGTRHASVTEILHFARQAEDFLKRQYLQGEMLKVFNTTTTLDECTAKLDALTEGIASASAAEDFVKPTLYSETLDTPYDGIKLYIDPIDSITGGFERGQVGTIGAFTGHGKSTAWLSALYANAKRGRKCVYLSLELPVNLVWLQLQARYYHEEKGMNVTTTDLRQQTLSKEDTEKVKQYEADFLRDITANVYVCDSSELTAGVTESSQAWIQLYRRWDRHLGGLDLVIHDHVGQYNLLYPDKGNRMLVLIRDATIRFRSLTTGKATCTGFAVQCNREGFKRAAKFDGVYDLAAIGDLNEVERTSAYVVFLYTSAEKLIMQETAVTMVKTRFGQPLTEPTPVAFLPAILTVGNTVELVSFGDSFADLSDGFGTLSESFTSIGELDDDL